MTAEVSRVSQKTPLLGLRTALVLRGRELRAYVADWKGANASKGKHNILIYGQGRSGTTLFEDLLCSTGYFISYHEVLNTVTREVLYPTAYVRGLGRKTRGENVILHVKPEHLGRSRRKPVDPRDFLTALVEDNWSIVHIQRHNVVAKIISKYVAKSRGRFHKTDDANESIQLDIQVDALIAQYQRSIALLDEENALLDGLPHIRLTYESDLERSDQHQRTVDTVLDQLGLDHQQVATQLRKINTFSPESLLSNLDELRAALEDKGWKWTL